MNLPIRNVTGECIKWMQFLKQQQRFRPILMTSLATSLGALPIALSLGASSTSRVPLGIVVVCGIMFSLILTLFVIPAVYTFISGKHKTEGQIDKEMRGETTRK